MKKTYNKNDFIIEPWAKNVFIIVLLFWTIILFSLALWNYSQKTSSIYNLALTVARDSYRKDLLFREWATSHGGVYVPVTTETEPGKYLINIPERDISTPSGKKMTLMNPAYIMRQVYESAEKKEGILGHLTSLNPIRPENAPDEWERESLLTFEKGETESVIISSISGKDYLRLMSPMDTTPGCLKCHAQQGYKIGDIRGGISVSIPWDPFRKAASSQLYVLIAGYSGVWILGLIGLVIIRRIISKNMLERKKSDKQIVSLLKEKEILLKEVHHRIKNNMNTIKGILFLQADSLKDSSAIAALHDAERRVESMMVLYDKLYLSDNFTDISIKKYLPVLVEEIVRNFPNSEKVKIEDHVDNFIIEAEKLFPLGIVVNEIITNMMKYAFEGRESGVIRLTALLNNNHVTIEIRDNGIGIPESINIKNSSGFGMQLVVMLLEQIAGTIRIERVDGTRFVLEFDQ